MANPPRTAPTPIRTMPPVAMPLLVWVAVVPSPVAAPPPVGNAVTRSAADAELPSEQSICA